MDQSFSMADVPEDIKDSASVARRLALKNSRTHDEEETLNRARLRIAFWACRREGIIASWENLRYVLGAHAEAIQPAYERMMSERGEAERLEAARKRAAETGDFWGGAENLDSANNKPRSP